MALIQRHNCEGCPFKSATVGSRGPIDSPFMIIGESPGREEVKQGAPFVGTSGGILDHALESAALPYPEPFITNSFLCWPPSKAKNEDSLNAAVSACRHRLLEAINAHPRKLVVTLGTPALRAVTGDYDLRITKERGKIIQPAGDIKGVEHALATVHPAYILRGGGNYRQFKGDIHYALSLYNGAEIKRNPDVDYLVLDTPVLLRRLVNFLERQPEGTLVAADLETGSSPDDPEGPGGFNHIDDSILMLGLCTRPDAVYVIPEELILHPLVARIFKNKNLRWAWHNGKFDIKFLWSYGYKDAYVHEDTMLMSYTLDERRGVHDLEEVAHDWLGSPRWKHILDKYKKSKQSYRVIPKPILYKYAAYDISNTYRLVEVLRPQINKDNNNKLLYEQTLLPASQFLAHVENTGLRVDKEFVKKNLDRLGTEASKWATEIYQIAEPFRQQGYDFTDKLVNSPKQLSQLLFECLGLKTKKKTTSTGDDVLEELSEKYPDHPLLRALRNYRKVQKQVSTYVLPLLDHMDGKNKIVKAVTASDGKLHVTFKLHGTATGRLASSDPMNLQNIPRDAMMRGQFIPIPGYTFSEPDLNQAELRSLAEMSGDKRLCAIYRGESNEGGVHDVMRSRMFGNPEDWSTADFQRYLTKFFLHHVEPEKQLKAILDEQKMKAKNVNFGIVYGITEFGLAAELEVSRGEARAYLQQWAETFPEAWAFIKECMRAPRRGQNLVTVFGNRKRHHIVTPENIHALEKEASNFPHQATASHIMLHGCIELYERFRREYDAYFVNMMHDGTLIMHPDNDDVTEAVNEEAIATLQAVPPKWGIKRVPFVAESKVGNRWGRDYMIPYDKWKATRRAANGQEQGRAA